MLTGQPADKAGGGVLESGTRHRWRCHLPGWRRDQLPEQSSRPCDLSSFGLFVVVVLACGILEWEWAVLEEVGNNNSKGKKLRAIRFLQGSQSKRS